MARGDHIYVVRPLGYSHHGIDLGNQAVIHFAPVKGDYAKGVIRISSLSEFAAGGTVKVVEYGEEADSPGVVIGRAESRLGEKSYNLLYHNCEHFAVWCKTGQPGSRQVTRVASLLNIEDDVNEQMRAVEERRVRVIREKVQAERDEAEQAYARWQKKHGGG